MKKNYSKICLIIALGSTPTMVFATYSDCINAGGSTWHCFWEAAGNPEVMYKQTHSNAQIKKVFDKTNNQCSRIPIKEQMNCLSKGFKSKKTGDTDKKLSKVTSKTVIKKESKNVSRTIISAQTMIKSKKVVSKAVKKSKKLAPRKVAPGLN